MKQYKLIYNIFLSFLQKETYKSYLLEFVGEVIYIQFCKAVSNEISIISLKVVCRSSALVSSPVTM